MVIWLVLIIFIELLLVVALTITLLHKSKIHLEGQEPCKTYEFNALDFADDVGDGVRRYLLDEAMRTTQNTNRHGLANVTIDDVKNIYNRNKLFWDKTIYKK